MAQQTEYGCIKLLQAETEKLLLFTSRFGTFL